MRDWDVAQGERDRDATVSASADGSAGDAAPLGSASRGVAAPVEVRLGDCIGRYTVRGLIGTGGMGQVFAAYDPELGRNIAVKLIRPGGARSPSRAQARLLREARALARLHHPNVVTVHGVGAHGDQIFVGWTNSREGVAESPRDGHRRVRERGGRGEPVCRYDVRRHRERGECSARAAHSDHDPDQA